MPNEDLTTAETATELEVSEGTVRRLIASGALRAEKRAGAWFVDACSLERLTDEILEDEEGDLEEDDEDEDIDDNDSECENCGADDDD